MFATLRSGMLSSVLQSTRGFARRQDGAAAVEFALVAVPFFALLFAILQTAIIFFASQALQAAVADSSRLIMTGQAQQANFTAADFKNAVCARVSALFNCATGVTVDVKNYSSFSAINNSPPVTNGQFDPSKASFGLAGPGCIQVVTLYYQWPVYVSLLGLADLNGGYKLMSASSVFKNEPYSSGGC